MSELECKIKLYFAGECAKGWQCKEREQCPAFKEKESNLKALTYLSDEWFKLSEKLAGLSCGGEKNRICCEKGGSELI